MPSEFSYLSFVELQPSSSYLSVGSRLANPRIHSHRDYRPLFRTSDGIPILGTNSSGREWKAPQWGGNIVGPKVDSLNDPPAGCNWEGIFTAKDHCRGIGSCSPRASSLENAEKYDFRCLKAGVASLDPTLFRYNSDPT